MPLIDALARARGRAFVICALAALAFVDVDVHAAPPTVPPVPTPAPTPVVGRSRPGRRPAPVAVPLQTKLDIVRRLLPGVPGSGGAVSTRSFSIDPKPLHLDVAHLGFDPAVGYLTFVGAYYVEGDRVSGPWRGQAELPYTHPVTTPGFGYINAGTVDIGVVVTGSTTYLMDCAIRGEAGDTFSFQTNNGFTYPTRVMLPMASAGPDSGHYLVPIVTAPGVQYMDGAIWGQSASATPAFPAWTFYGCDVHKVT